MKVDKICCKCKTSPATVHIRHAYYCQSCFLYVFVGKYRSILGKARSLASAKKKVLLACSGGPSSIAMLQLTKEFMHVEPHEKKKIQLVSQAVVCHLDESTLFPEQQGSTTHLKSVIENEYPNMQYVSHRLEDVYDPQFTNGQQLDKVLETVAGSSDYEYKARLRQPSQEHVRMDNSEKLKKLFDSVTKVSAKEDLYWHIKMAMLIAIAKREGCSCIFMADSSTRQAIKMISMTSKGRGYSIPLDIGVENDTSFPDLAILRPMKDILSKEIGLYNRFCNLEKYVLAPTNWATKAPPKNSIERLTEDFIVTLERDFPSTVSTISRTASKLTPSMDMDMSRRCAICLMPYQEGIEDWRRRITVTDVEAAESETPNSAHSEACRTECCGNGSCSIQEDSIDLNRYLCYSCQVDMKDCKPDATSYLPPYTTQNVHDNLRESSLRGQIEEFLLSDSDD